MTWEALSKLRQVIKCFITLTEIDNLKWMIITSNLFVL